MSENVVTPPITKAEILNEVPGGADLLRWFEGRVPSFHDAEIISVTLDREGISGNIRIRTFEMTSDVDAQGYFVLKKHVVVGFQLSGITGLELTDFNHQNVIDGLSVSDASQAAAAKLVVEVRSIFGFGGKWRCQSAEVTAVTQGPSEA